MAPRRNLLQAINTLMLITSLTVSSAAISADKDLLDILLANGVITPAQHAELLQKETIIREDIVPQSDPDGIEVPVTDKSAAKINADIEERIDTRVAEAVETAIEAEFPVKASYGSGGFRLETRAGNWQTNLQWRAQLRYTSPYSGDPRQLSAFDAQSKSTFEPRRLRMKIGGHGYQPWLKYYFEVDLQPSRDPGSGGSSSSARVIDWRIDLARWDWGTLRVGQWKIDLNRERGDSSGRQQFVERSIVNRAFTIDRQVGIQLRGHLFKNTPADLRYYAGVFNGEGRGVRDNDTGKMYVGRLQWNFLGRDLSWRQTDVEYTQRPTASLAIGGATTQGSCTRWSSSDCGNLDGYTSAAAAASDQFEVDQVVQEFAYKYRGLSIQQEYHRKTVNDRIAGTENDLSGGYFQSGYFFHNLFPSIPAPLEFAVRYAFIDEPNSIDRALENEREELTFGANWFFSGHNNKLTLDVSHLALEDGLLGRSESGHRVRLQWDVSF